MKETLGAFLRGVFAGSVALVFGYLISLGGFAPFPPEVAVEKAFSFIPGSIESPFVVAYGGAAKYIGLFVGSVVTVLLLGVFAVIFVRYFSRWVRNRSTLSNFEKFLSYSIVLWLFFGAIVLPLSGGGFFGLSLLSQGYSLLYPLGLLLEWVLYCWVLSWSYPNPTFLVRLSSTETKKTGSSGPGSRSRRNFLEKGVIAVGVLILGALSLEGASSLLGSTSNEAIRPGTPATPIAPPIFADPRLAGLVDSEITDDDTFYIVDIDFSPPVLNASSYLLNLTSQSKTLKSYTLGDLLALPPTTEYSTFECVSNTVNGNLISNAKWSGVKISDLLANAGANLNGIEYAVFYSADGYSVGIPISKAIEQDSILALSMNGQPLPTNHGYPVRAVIPGLYGMMSAKWLNSIDLLNTSYVGYWQSEGYVENATVNTLAFIRVPSDGEAVSLSQNSGSVIIGGFAFAGDRGISKVEVSVDGGNTWLVATLKPPLSGLSWTLWAIKLDNPSTGFYNVYARATDGTGALETSSTAAPYPSGATGYASSSFEVIS
jgi:DMSO/TMAO reductase YedYZ molybdopterin-dependent catalytic subunit